MKSRLLRDRALDTQRTSILGGVWTRVLCAVRRISWSLGVCLVATSAWAQPAADRSHAALAGSIEAQTLQPTAEPASAVSTPETSGEQPQGSSSPHTPTSSVRRSRSATEVSVRGNRTAAQRLQESAEAVSVINLRRAQEQTVDMGEVLARTQGIAVRRSGGVGSAAGFSLNGLQGEQIRLFLDGVPLELAGYPAGITNVPVALVERVEVYRGVVPIRFGTDALGGAVNLVSNSAERQRLTASYQVGSFGTHRLTVDGRYRDDPSGVVVGVGGYLDNVANDYPIDVVLADSQGRERPATVRRFHDAYNATGLTLELGVVDKPWAKRLSLRGFISTYDKELQHNPIMTKPYGAARYGEAVGGLTSNYQVALHRDVDLELIANYARRSIDFVDESWWLYNWEGERIRMRTRQGEVGDDGPADQTIWQHGVYGRALLSWRIAPQHTVRIVTSPQWTTRSGIERDLQSYQVTDPLAAKHRLVKLTSGLEYEASLLGDRISNILFVKDYVYDAHTVEPTSRTATRTRDRSRHLQGIGDGLRVRLSSWLYAKASYEYATRLPATDEVFGDGVLTRANLDLKPEVSHNFNLGLNLALRHAVAGEFTLDVNGFWRESTNLITRIGMDTLFTYQNVYNARGFGLENAATWVVPARWLSFNGTFTWQDVRNVSNKNTFADQNGDRIPNQPYIFASWGARLRPARDETLVLFYHGRYVHSFYRTWESASEQVVNARVEAQVTHVMGASCTFSPTWGRLTATLEIDNLTDAKVFDNYGVQRPGRGVYLKIIGSI